MELEIKKYRRVSFMTCFCLQSFWNIKHYYSSRQLLEVSPNVIRPSLIQMAYECWQMYLSCCNPKSIVLTIHTCHLESPIKNTAQFKFCVWGIKFSTFLCYPGRNGWSNEKSNRLRNLKDSYLISSNIGLILLIIKRNVS